MYKDPSDPTQPGLAPGSKKLADGTDQLADGITNPDQNKGLIAGAKALDEGANQLKTQATFISPSGAGGLIGIIICAIILIGCILSIVMRRRGKIS